LTQSQFYKAELFCFPWIPSTWRDSNWDNLLFLACRRYVIKCFQNWHRN
jgi:hypothetical protein